MDQGLILEEHRMKYIRLSTLYVEVYIFVSFHKDKIEIGAKQFL